MPTKKEMIEQLRAGKVNLPPLAIHLLRDQSSKGQLDLLDASVEVSWEKQSARFAVECKSHSTPRAFRDGVSLLRSSQLPKGVYPMLFTPFLSESQLLELEAEGISGIDLCGNGVIKVPGIYYFFRSGQKNRFSTSSPIKNIYHKNSSMVGRVFLCNPNFNAVQDILAEVNRRNIIVSRWNGKPISFPTISKSLKTLEDDLIIERNDLIRLLQPDKLLDKLEENYEPPRIKNQVSLKLPGTTDDILKTLISESDYLRMPVVATGLSSVIRYAVMQRGDKLSIYCPQAERLVERLPGSQSDRFPNLELIETEDQPVYFDARMYDKFWWVSPVQVYLELMTGDKRDRETAEQVKSYIVNNLQLDGI